MCACVCVERVGGGGGKDKSNAYLLCFSEHVNMFSLHAHLVEELSKNTEQEYSH